MGVIITPKVDPIFMVNGKAPGTHFRGERSIELPHLAGVGVDSEKKEGGFILAEGEIDGTPFPCLSGSDMTSPAHGVSHRDAEVTEGK
jgi:hypothetical protein